MYTKLKNEFEDSQLFNSLAADLPVPPDPSETPDPLADPALATNAESTPVTLGKRS
jgi:hypothetical protein